MKTIWIGHIPDIFGYGIMVAETTEDKAMKALKREFDKWDATRSFKESLEYFGGGVFEVELGKGYNDNFNY
jgi:hypothetical protein